MIPLNGHIIIIYNGFIKKGSFSWKEKLPETFSYGVIADDTLPLNDRAYELPIIPIYKVEWFIG